MNQVWEKTNQDRSTVGHLTLVANGARGTTAKISIATMIMAIWMKQADDMWYEWRTIKRSPSRNMLASAIVACEEHFASRSPSHVTRRPFDVATGLERCDDRPWRHNDCSADIVTFLIFRRDATLTEIGIKSWCSPATYIGS
jgi:hypothetical protein